MYPEWYLRIVLNYLWKNKCSPFIIHTKCDWNKLQLPVVHKLNYVDVHSRCKKYHFFSGFRSLNMIKIPQNFPWTRINCFQSWLQQNWHRFFLKVWFAHLFKIQCVYPSVYLHINEKKEFCFSFSCMWASSRYGRSWPSTTSNPS